MICEDGTVNLKIFTDRIIFMSMTLIGQEKETKEFVSRIQKKSQGTREKILAGTLDVSRSRRRKEVVWNISLDT